MMLLRLRPRVAAMAVCRVDQCGGVWVAPAALRNGGRFCSHAIYHRSPRLERCISHIPNL